MAISPTEETGGVETADPVKPAGVRDRDVQIMGYPPRLMAPDMAKSVAGLLICGVIALIPEMLPIIQWTAAGLALLFVVYFVRTFKVSIKDLCIGIWYPDQQPAWRYGVRLVGTFQIPVALFLYPSRWQKGMVRTDPAGRGCKNRHRINIGRF